MCLFFSAAAGQSQKARLAALASFKSEAVPLLLATDVASRGLDIPTVDLVVNYDLPMLARYARVRVCMLCIVCCMGRLGGQGQGSE